MADLKISQLGDIGTNVTTTDEFAVVDTSASETKKVKYADLLSATALGTLSGTPIPSGKINFASGAIEDGALDSNCINTINVKDDQITGAKLADNATTLIASSAPTALYVGQKWIDSDDHKEYYWNGSAWTAVAAGTTSVTGSSGQSIPNLNVTSTASGTAFAITAAIPNAGQNTFLAGPSSGGTGAVSARAIAAADLPTATSSDKGAVSVNGAGLVLDGTQLKINNTVTASGSTYSVCQHDANGLVTASRAIAAGDLPLASSSAVGAIKSGSGLSIDGSGVLTITNSVAAATKCKVTYNADGLITAGADLADSDLPNHSAALLTSGTLPIARIGSSEITGAKLANASTCLFQSIAQDGYPTAEYQGQMLFDPTTEDAYVNDGSAWLPITTLTKGNLLLGGVYNATSSTLTTVTTHGASVGLTAGQNLPTPSTTLDNTYVVVGTGGTPSGIPNGPSGELIPPDYILATTSSTGSVWTEIDLSTTVSAPTAASVSVASGWGGSATNVQAALAEVESDKLDKAGGIISGTLEIGSSGTLKFEGSSADANETTFSITNATADRTIVFPDASGNVLLSGAGSIADSDISSSAAIAHSKLAALADGKVLIGSGSNVPTAQTISGDITISNAGVAAIGSGAIVNADINASAAIAGSKLAAGSTSAQGALQLSDATNSTSTSLAATANAVKTSYDLANAALPKAGGTMTGALTVGADDQGYDVKLFGDTASAYLLWDTSDDALKTAGGATIDVVKDKFKIGGVAMTCTSAELNVLDGVTSTTAELNILDGVTSTATELNILDGVTSTTAELNILDGVTATATEINLLDGKTAVGDAVLASDQTWSGAQRGAITALTDASTVAVDFNSGNNFSLTLAGNRTLGQPSNQVAGQSGAIFITQDGTGSRTLAYHADWKWVGGTAPTLSTTAAAVDRIDYIVAAANKIHAVVSLDVK